MAAYSADLVERFGLTVRLVPLPDYTRERLGIPEDSGLLVLAVMPQGPARALNLAPSDILIRLGGRSTRDLDGLRAALAASDAWESLTAIVVRNGDRLSLPS